MTPVPSIRPLGPAKLSFAPLATALSLFAVMFAVLLFAAGGSKIPMPAATAKLPSPSRVVDLILETDGYASVLGLTFPVNELAMHLGGLEADEKMPAVRVRVPKDLELPVLMEVMKALKAAAVEQTSVELIPVP